MIGYSDAEDLWEIQSYGEVDHRADHSDIIIGPEFLRKGTVRVVQETTSCFGFTNHIWSELLPFSWKLSIP